jgi:hypothetical protein
MYGGPIGVTSDLDPAAETVCGYDFRLAINDIIE